MRYVRKYVDESRQFFFLHSTISTLTNIDTHFVKKPTISKRKVITAIPTLHTGNNLYCHNV